MALHVRARDGRTFSWPSVLASIGLAGILVAACGSSGPTTLPVIGPGATAAASAAATTPVGPPQSAAVAATDQAPNVNIPPGREIAEGGGGPVQYTFREEWRRALAEAQKWRNGAYLVKAVGQQVNDEGVPRSWAFAFIDKADADAVFRVEIDPWGKVTETEEVTGEGVISFVDSFTKRIPFDVIDSDEVVKIGKAALAVRYDPLKTRDPLIALSSNEITGGALHWTYMLFDESTAEYVSALIDPHTGEATLHE